MRQAVPGPVHETSVHEPWNARTGKAEQGFFTKEVKGSDYLKDGWQQQVWEKFHSEYPEVLLLFYINHLGAEIASQESVFLPAAA